ncbi:hypothetical protein [Sphingomonas crusticola]|uniref:hypothetical protein n=1 Tax=Sphingomonas crusticola TaxID=1697973 RepID=UPI000E2809E9|nr:hypothetical protein [Sphingomonas crusticola]
MISYRLYRLRDDRVSSTATFDAADDVAAIEAARAETNEVDCELWCDNRLVAFIPATKRDA